MTPLVLKVAEVAALCNVSESHVRNMVRRGDLPKVSGLGRIIRIPASAVSAISHEEVQQ